MNAVSIILFIFFMKQTVGIRTKERLFLMLCPGIVSTMLILISLRELYYVEGKTTFYSMGTAAVTCYVSAFTHFLVILCAIVRRHRTIENKKRMSILLFISLCAAILIAQILMPEILISSLMPTIAVIGLYVNYEDPSIRRLKIYNDSVVMSFATIVESRDDSTGSHIKRTRGYVSILMDEMRFDPRYKHSLSKDYIENVIKAAPMHDIGKIATPDAILRKPGKLTDEEYAIMKAHAEKGGDIIQKTFFELEDEDYRQIAYEVARHHHEKWNGAGYPEGLKREEIPLHARVMAIADVFDAVSAKRCYRDALPLDACFGIIEKGSGSDFDPALVKLFLQEKNRIIEYYNRYA